MFRCSPCALSGAAALALLLPLSTARAEPPRDAPEGVEVLGRGPVHEAFAQPVEEKPGPSPAVPKEPPPAPKEVPPEQKPGDKAEWVAGYWQWDADKEEFIWVSGFWRKPPPGRAWVPGRYVKTDDGWRWVAGYWGDAAQKDKDPALLPQPPEPLDVAPPPTPNSGGLYVPGSWVYVDGRYRWRAPYYIDYRAEWVWHPAQYVWTPDGYVFVDSYWDFEPAARGPLFAPVYIDPLALASPNFSYTPSYCVSLDFLPTALFVRPRFHHYYFGDYYGRAYAKLGFRPFHEVRLGGRGYDPVYGYLRHVATAPTWERDLRTLYVGRHNGDLVLPPRTLAQQQALVRQINVDRTVKVANVQHVTPLVTRTQTPRRDVTLEIIGSRPTPSGGGVARGPAPTPAHAAPAPAHVAPAHAAPAHAIPAHAAPAHAAPAHFAPAHPAPAHAAPTHSAGHSAHSAPAHSHSSGKPHR